MIPEYLLVQFGLSLYNCLQMRHLEIFKSQEKMAAPTLKTERLILRQWRDEDLPLFAKMNANPRVMEFFPSTLTESESTDLAKRIQQELREKKYGLWAVEVVEDFPFIGFVGLHYAEFKADFTPCVEIGWRLACDGWGKGYATEAATKVVSYAFHELKLKQLVAFTTVANLRSRKVMEKLGMRKEGDFEHPNIPIGNSMRPHVLYRLNNPMG